MATTRPDVDFPTITLPIILNTVEVYSQKNGTPGKLPIEDVKRYTEQSLIVDTGNNTITITKIDGNQTVDLPDDVVQDLLNGLYIDDGVGKLGGDLIEATEIDCGIYQILFIGTANHTVQMTSGSNLAEQIINGASGVQIRANDGSIDYEIIADVAGCRLIVNNANAVQVTPSGVQINTPGQLGATAKTGSIMRLEAAGTGRVEYTDWSVPALITGSDGAILVVTDASGKTAEFSDYTLPTTKVGSVDGSLMQVQTAAAGDVIFSPYAFPRTIADKPDGGILQANASGNAVQVTPFKLPKTAPVTSSESVLAFNTVSSAFTFKQRKMSKSTVTTDGSGFAVFPHGMGVIPSTVVAFVQGVAAVAILDDVDITNITLQVFQFDGDPLASTEVTYHWIAQE